ncbi:clustered mitochondria protein homolog [Hoplias malabaricus]|uniref:clustered mitochondria protein homolog n=1 Tax=Hoplias malabaricus TaxID=27720 RepID=UPI003462C4F9
MRDSAKRRSGEQKQTDSSQLINDKKPEGLIKEDGGMISVKVQGAGVDAFELQVNGFWLVQDAILTILGREEVAPRTSLALALSGVTLDPFTELQNIKGFKAGVTLRLVEEPYSPRSARAHLARVLELLRAAGPQDDLKEGRSPSILSTLTHTPEIPHAGHSAKGKRGNNNKTEQPTEAPPPPDYILPGATEHPPLATVLPSSTYNEAPSCLLDMSLSCWNPPPGSRKLQGDLLYISVQTLEGKHCDITSSPRGFYLNRSTTDVFDPRPASSTPVCHCLTDLLSQISPQFKHNFSALRHRPNLPAEESMSTPYRTLSWLGGQALHSHKSNYSCRLGLEHGLNTQAPDWNEEMQAARDLPQTTLEERLQRDKALLQVNSAFVWAVSQAAEKVIDGFVDPINNCSDDPAFLWGSLYLSMSGPGQEWLGGERGRRAAQRLELQAIQAYSDLEGDLQALHTLPTALADYRGIRLSAQGLAPGLQGPDQPGVSRGLLYGFSAGPLENPARRKLLELLAQSAKALALQRHSVMGPSGYQLPLFTSTDAQGLLGADGRYYVLDVFRTMPADANFHVVEGEESKEGGVPRRFPHNLCRLRPELVKAFIQHKHSQFTQRVRARMEENGGVEECVKSSDSRGTEAVRGACKDIGSVSDIIFEMRFNPNIFSPGVEFPSSDSAAVSLQERLLKEAAAFIINDQIPGFVNDASQGSEFPIDGATLRNALHQKGINLRYLGHLISFISQSEHKGRLRHITRLAYGEIVVRCAQRIFNGYIQGVELASLSAAASHFLCCLLVPHFTPASNGEESKKRSRRRGHKSAGTADSIAWGNLSGNELWSLICQDALETYGLKQGLGSSADQLVEQYGLQKISLLREICLKTGIQLRLRDYVLDNRNKAPITPDDVLNLLPVVKHVSMATTDASRLFQAAQNSLQKGLLEKAYEQLKEASYLFGRICDDLHPEACQCLSMLARVAYLQSHPAEARSVQLRVVVISERVLGFDHPNTIQQYALLAVYMFAGGETALALRCLYRAKLLMLLVHGEDHPYTAVLDSSLGLMLQGDQSLQYLQNALKLSISFRGAMDLTTALNHHLLAQRMCIVGDYRGGMTQEKEAHNIFQSQCGENHPQTKCSSEFLKVITQQAVRVERSIRQGGAEFTDSSKPESLTPTLETTLEQLALINGILKTSYSMRIMEFKEKLKERRAAEEAENAKAELSTDAEMDAEASVNVKQTEDEDDTNGKHQKEDSDVLEEKISHLKINGQVETHLQNGEKSSENEEAEHSTDPSKIISSIPTKKQSEPNEAINENSEPALVKEEDMVTEDVMEKLTVLETPANN